MTTSQTASPTFSQSLAQAFGALGNAFLAQPHNDTLRHQLHTGKLLPTAYYTLLRRLVYRILFLAVAEARGCLPAPRAPRSVRQRYQRLFALSRARHTPTARRLPPLYQQVLTGLGALSGQLDGAPMGIPLFGTFLAPSPALAILPECVLPDEALLELLQTLDTTLQQHPQYPTGLAEVDGAVIEALHLAAQQWQPTVHSKLGSFQLTPLPGAAPHIALPPGLAPALIDHLLDTTLEPVVQEALATSEPDAALLALTICDPACGTGTLLRAAARRLATHLEQVRGGEKQQALHEVIQHCLYGVDLNASTVEVCQMSLALEALHPGSTGTALDRHIRCGDSLAGTTPHLLAQGIPEQAFTAIADDTPSVVLALRQRHRQERQGQMGFAFPPLAAARPGRRRRGRKSPPGPSHVPAPGSAAHATLLAHAWCAAFVWPKRADTTPALTQETFRQLHVQPELVAPETHRSLAELAGQYQFWHWHLAFPEVFAVSPSDEMPQPAGAGWQGGFDVVLSRPPWTTLDFDAQDWGLTLRPELAEAPNATTRRQQLTAWCSADPVARTALQAARQQAARRAHLLRHTGLASHDNTVSRQTVRHFIAWGRSILRPTGRLGYLVLAPDLLRERDCLQLLLTQQALVSFATLSNTAQMVPWLPRTALLGILTLAGPQRPQATASVVWLARQPHELKDSARQAPLQAADLALLNPNTRAYPALRSARDAALVKALYRQFPILQYQEPAQANVWHVEGRSLCHLNREAAVLRTPQQLEAEGWRFDGARFRHGQSSYVPVYEGAMLHALTCPTPQHLPALPRWWVPAGHVVQATAPVPPALIHAYAQKRPEDILKTLAAWLAGHHLTLGYQTCTSQTLAQTYTSIFQALPRTPGAWTAEPAMAREWPLTSDDLRLMQRQPDVLLLARQLMEQRCPTWLVGWRERLDPTYAVQATILPRAGLAQSAPWLHFVRPEALLAGCLVANLSSLVLAFCARQKLLGPRLTPMLLYQLPVIPPATYAAPCPWHPQQALQDWLLPRLLALLYTHQSLAPWARACGYTGAPLQTEADSRDWYRSELEAAYLHLYGCTRADVLHLLDTTPRVRPSAVLPGSTWPPHERLLFVYDALHQASATETAYRPQIAPPRLDTQGAGATPAQTSDGPAGLRPRLVTPRPEERYKTCLPLLPLEAVVHAFAAGYDLEPEAWVMLPATRTLRPGMFVAQMPGAAMAPQIPDGAYCLFERQHTGDLRRFQGRTVLVQHQDIHDPDTDGPYTVRRYLQEQPSSARSARTAPVVRLLPLQADYPPIILTPHQTEGPYVIAELLTVLDSPVTPQE